MKPLKPVRTLAVTSGKGGVGKTNVSVNLGLALTELGRRVLLFDADMSLANVDVLLGLQTRYNLSHLLSGERALEEILVETPGGMKIVPAASGIQKMAELPAAEQAGLIRAFGDMDEDVDFLIVDTAAGISGTVVNFSRACQEIAVVLCDEPTSLTDAYAFIKLLNRDYGVYRFQIVANMVQGPEQGQGLFVKLCRVTDRYLDVTLNLLGTIPYDANLRRAVQRQSPVVQSFPRSPAALAFRDLARRAEQLAPPEQAGGYLEFFVERMIRYGAGQPAYPS